MPTAPGRVPARTRATGRLGTMSSRACQRRLFRTAGAGPWPAEGEGEDGPVPGRRGDIAGPS